MKNHVNVLLYIGASERVLGTHVWVYDQRSAVIIGYNIFGEHVVLATMCTVV